MSGEAPSPKLPSLQRRTDKKDDELLASGGSGSSPQKVKFKRDSIESGARADESGNSAGQTPELRRHRKKKQMGEKAAKMQDELNRDLLSLAREHNQVKKRKRLNMKARYTPSTPPPTPKGSVRSKHSLASLLMLPTEVVVTGGDASFWESFKSLCTSLPCCKKTKKVRDNYSQTDSDFLTSLSSDDGYKTVSVG